MSKKEKVTEQNEEKVMTKYDLKMKRREEAKAKEMKEKRISAIIGIAVVVALVCLIASFPIRTYIAVHETFVTINGESISKVEFDYNYNVVKSNYISQYGAYLSYFGLDTTADLSKQMYSDTLTWEDYFQQETVDTIIRSKALKAEAEAAGFTYDTAEEFESFKEGVKSIAAEAGISTKDYLKQTYGSYATFGRVEGFVKESVLVNAYYAQMADEKTPSDEDIQSYYEENKQDYDSVDYMLTLVAAELPTEPTELADPVTEDEAADETAAGEAAEDTTAGEDSTAEAAYEPSEAEIEKAMADAKVLAEEAEKTVAEDGEFREDAKYSGTSYLIRDWLFDDSRTEGDTTVIEDTSGNQYYVLSFVKRYLVDTASANVHIIMTEAENGQTVLDEWQNGKATEESFAQLADKYNEGTSFTAEGGYYEGVTPGGTLNELSDWLFDTSRAEGDTTVLTRDDGNAYVLYYAGPNDPEWKLTIRTVILSDIMEEYLQEISEGITVEDSKGNLNYLKVQAAEEAAAATQETAEGAEGTEAADENQEAGSASAETVDGTEAE